MIPVPLNPGDGSEWTEGLLWIQPETVCVSFNITIDYTRLRTQLELSEANDLVVTNQGGFFGLAKCYPRINLNDTQNRPELFTEPIKEPRATTGISWKFWILSGAKPR